MLLRHTYGHDKLVQYRMHAADDCDAKPVCGGRRCVYRKDQNGVSHNDGEHRDHPSHQLKEEAQSRFWKLLTPVLSSLRSSSTAFSAGIFPAADAITPQAVPHEPSREDDVARRQYCRLNK